VAGTTIMNEFSMYGRMPSQRWAMQKWPQASDQFRQARPAGQPISELRPISTAVRKELRTMTISGSSVNSAKPNRIA